MAKNTGKDEVIWGELQKQLEAMGLKVKRGTIQDALFYRGGSRKIKKKHLTAWLRLATAGMVPEQKRARKAILATSSIKKATSITALFAKLRPQRQKCMIAGLICR